MTAAVKPSIFSVKRKEKKKLNIKAGHEHTILKHFSAYLVRQIPWKTNLSQTQNPVKNNGALLILSAPGAENYVCLMWSDVSCKDKRKRMQRTVN